MFVHENLTENQLPLVLTRGHLTSGNAVVGPVNEQIRVFYIVSALTAESDIDFILSSGEILFAPGETRASITAVVS